MDIKPLWSFIEPLQLGCSNSEALEAVYIGL
jgi:hypothetical protein